jgi:hypothetical protein
MTVHPYRYLDFRCADCGRHVIRMVPVPNVRLCATCIHMPGWFNTPELRAVFDPDFKLPLPKAPDS